MNLFPSQNAYDKLVDFLESEQSALFILIHHKLMTPRGSESHGKTKQMNRKKRRNNNFNVNFLVYYASSQGRTNLNIIEFN